MNTLPPPHPYCRQHILIAATLPPPHPYCRQYAATASYCRQSAAMPPGLLPPCRHAARPPYCRQIAARMQSCRHPAAIACLLPPLPPQLPPERLGGNKNFGHTGDLEIRGRVVSHGVGGRPKHQRTIRFPWCLGNSVAFRAVYDAMGWVGF